VVSEDWYFVSHRLHLAKSAIDAGYQVGLLSHFTQHKSLIESSGITVFDWSLDRQSRNPILEVKALREVFSTISDFKPDIIHSVAIKPVVYSAIVSKWYPTGANVCALGGLGYIFSSTKISARLLRPFVIMVFRWALKSQQLRLILQNPDDKATVLEANIIEENRIRLIRGAGVDTSSFSPQPEESEFPIVVLPARMLWDKGVGVFIECAQYFKKTGKSARFVLVGEPDTHNPECVPLKQLKEWNDKGIVEWWGRRDDMPNVFHKSSIVCLPTTYGEGLPKALLEAASCGRPIVTYDVAGCREIVKDGLNGFLVPFKDKTELINALHKLLDEPGLRAQMGRLGRELVLKEFSQERVAADTKKVWDEVIN